VSIVALNGPSLRAPEIVLTIAWRRYTASSEAKARLGGGHALAIRGSALHVGRKACGRGSTAGTEWNV